MAKNAYLLEHQNTVARTYTLWQLGNAALIEVWTGEAPVVKVDLGAAVLPIGLTCYTTKVTEYNY